jgi:phage terminase small subunit
MKRGPKQKPCDETMPSCDAPPAPDHISGAARLEFCRVVAELYATRGLRPTDATLVEVYARAYATWLWAEGVLDRDPANRLAQSRSNQSCFRMAKMACVLGLGASNRKRAGLRVDEAAGEEDPTADFVRAGE